MGPSDYQAVFDQVSSKVRTPCVTVLATKSSVEQARLGLIVAKKHVKRAVDRNRLKRVIREQFRLHQYSLTGLDIVVIVRPGANKRADVVKCLEQSWNKLID